MDSVPSSDGRIPVKPQTMPREEHEFRAQSPDGQARELGLGKKSESLAQLGSNEETNIAVEKKNLQDSQT